MESYHRLQHYQCWPRGWSGHWYILRPALSCHHEPSKDGTCHFVWARFGHGPKSTASHLSAVALTSMGRPKTLRRKGCAVKLVARPELHWSELRPCRRLACPRKLGWEGPVTNLAELDLPRENWVSLKPTMPSKNLAPGTPPRRPTTRRRWKSATPSPERGAGDVDLATGGLTGAEKTGRHQSGTLLKAIRPPENCAWPNVTSPPVN